MINDNIHLNATERAKAFKQTLHGEENLNLGFGEEKLKEKQIVNTRNAYNTFSGKRAMETVEFPIDLKA